MISRNQVDFSNKGNRHFHLIFKNVLTKFYVSFENFVLLGDLNFDIMDATKGRTLRDVCKPYDTGMQVSRSTLVCQGLSYFQKERPTGYTKLQTSKLTSYSFKDI